MKRVRDAIASGNPGAFSTSACLIVVSLVQNAAMDLAGTGVRVTSIDPGMIETEFTLVRTGGDQAASDALYANMDPMTAEDLADTIWWVALPADGQVWQLTDALRQEIERVLPDRQFRQAQLEDHEVAEAMTAIARRGRRISGGESQPFEGV